MRKTLREFLTELREVATSGLGIRIRSYLIVYVLFLIGCLVFNLLELAGRVNWDQRRIADMVIEFISIVYHMLMSLQFAVLVQALATKLTEMRSNLEVHLKTSLKNSSARDLKIIVCKIFMCQLNVIWIFFSSLKILYSDVESCTWI